MKNGGTAFPTPIAGNRDQGVDYSAEPGMSLRDYMATHTRIEPQFLRVIATMTNEELLREVGDFPKITPAQGYIAQKMLRARLEARMRARLRYIDADAMLEERE